jgi:hypothetical protein
VLLRLTHRRYLSFAIGHSNYDTFHMSELDSEQRARYFGEENGNRTAVFWPALDDDIDDVWQHRMTPTATYGSSTRTTSRVRICGMTLMLCW